MNITPPWELWSEEAALRVFKGDHDAIRFLRDLMFWTHIYDDLIDRDKPVDDSNIHAMMWKLWFSIPQNPFFAKYRSVLEPVIATGILNWRAANEMEKSGSLEELRIAHVTRYSIVDVALIMLGIIGGPEYAAEQARAVRLMFQGDTWEHYEQEKT